MSNDQLSCKVVKKQKIDTDSQLSTRSETSDVSKRKFVCRKFTGTIVCLQNFNTAEEIRSHTEQFHKNKCNFECTYKNEDGTQCDKVYGNNSHLVKHIKTAHTQKKLPFLCKMKTNGKMCFKRFATTVERKTHQLDEHKQDFTCYHILDNGQSCGVANSNKANLKNHVDTVHMKKRHKCTHLLDNTSICIASFTSKQNLQAHIDSTHLKKKYNCTFLVNNNPCGKECSSKQHLKQHINGNHKGKRFPCLFVSSEGVNCKKAYTSKNGLEEHVKSFHDKIMWSCDKILPDGNSCKKKYASESGLQYHVKRIHENKRYNCTFKNENGEQCEKKYVDKESLLSHVASIHEKVVFVCGFKKPNGNICNTLLRSKKALYAHKRTIHCVNRYRKYKCLHKKDGEKCDKAFFTQGALCNHKKSHYIGKNHRCTLCPKTFKLKGSLTQHVNQHLGINLHYCPDKNCPYTSVSSSNVKKHYLGMHSGDGAKKRRVKEHRIANLLDNAGITYIREAFVDYRCLKTQKKSDSSFVFNRGAYMTLAEEAKKSFAKIDFLICTDRCVVCLEVDEHQHYAGDATPWSYTVACDMARMGHIITAYTMVSTMDNQPVQPVLWIRYNPDKFHINGNATKLLPKFREEQLIKLIENFQPTQSVSVIYMYYDSQTDSVGNVIPDILSHSEYDPGFAKCVLNGIIQ